MKILNWINGDMDSTGLKYSTGLKWLDLVLKLREQTEKDVEY